MSTPRRLTLEILPERYAIWQLPAGEPLPDPADLLSVTSVEGNRSVVSTEAAVPAAADAVTGYRCLRLQGEFPLEETGILSRLSTPLAHSGIPLFVISTFATDYLLLRECDIPKARRALAADDIAILPPERGGVS